ncbi:ABC transporter permease subunit [Clostridium sp. MCC353]|uniref:ABC transporter permease n=1 Tax=Clostridium sp. MCC353 TaxID=2592646 RepID=UPI001C020F20|nr:ABC transporter permease [Clostridium sp. MCC353]MBT9775041.1 ABC transporter permease subunit [Clostridium sp. MCC353]
MMEKQNIGKVERMKLKHKKLGLIGAGSMSLMALWIWYGLLHGSQVWEDGYSFLIYDIGILQTIFMPLVLAMTASRICDVEHKGGAWKLLYTLADRDTVYYGKIRSGTRYVLLLALIQLLIILGAAAVYPVTQPLPVKELLFWLAGTLILSEGLFLFQMILSFSVENQLISLVIGLLGSFLGLFALYLPVIYRLIPWCYYAVLVPVEMEWNIETRAVSYDLTRPDYGLLAVVLVLDGILYGWGKWLFRKKEV